MRDSALGALWVQSFIAIALCFIVLASEVALVATDRLINDAMNELSDQREFEQRLRVQQRPREERLRRPELVALVLLDGLRADHLGLYGHERETAPRLSDLARKSVVFETVGAQSAHSLVSGKSLMTGKYPSTLMLEETSAELFDLSTIEAPREYLVRTFVGVAGTLAAGLRSAGYRTGGFSDGEWLCRESGFDRGFDTFDEEARGDEALVGRAGEWLLQNRQERAFLLLHPAAIRCPFEAPAPFDGLFCPTHSTHGALTAGCDGADSPPDEETLEVLRDHYDGAIAAADSSLGELLAHLRELDLFEESLIVVTSGHGVSLGERGRMGSGGLYLEQLLVPLIVKTPASWNVPAQRIDDPVELVDVLPTLLESCGVEPDRNLDGTSLLPTILRGVRGRRYLVAQTTLDQSPDASSNPAKRSLVDPGNWQVIHDPKNERVELFFLDRDPDALEPVVDLGDFEIPPVLEGILSKPIPGVARRSE